MKRKTAIRLTTIAIAGLLSCLLLCRFLCTPENRMPEIKGISSLSVTGLTDDSLFAAVNVIVLNKNSSELSLKKLTLGIAEGNNPLGIAASQLPVVLKGREEGIIGLNVALSAKKLAGLLSQGKDSLRLDLTGSAEADMGLFTVPVKTSFPFYISLKSDIISAMLSENAPGGNLVTLGDASLQGVTLKETVIGVSFTVSNPYDLKVRVLDFPAKIYLNGKYAGTGNLSEPIGLSRKGQSGSGKLLFHLSNARTAAGILGNLTSGKILYEARGTMSLEIFNSTLQLPYTFQGTLFEL